MNIRNSDFELLAGLTGIALFVLALFVAMALLSNQPQKSSPLRVTVVDMGS
jgi:hypothetical protein